MNSEKILLHTCCAPCLIYIDKYFKEKNISYTSLYYNPNIHPYKEYLRRLNTLKDFLNDDSRLMVEDSYMESTWKENNCDFCYDLRIKKTAYLAKKHGFKGFSSTLFISPYQDHEKMLFLGNKYMKEFDIEFVHIDFRENFREGQNMARDEGMYKQKYCGCINSYNSSKFKDKITWD